MLLLWNCVYAEAETKFIINSSPDKIYYSNIEFGYNSIIKLTLFKEI